MLDFFEVRAERRLHPVLYRASLGGFALARLWEGATIHGPERGRAFENALYAFCERERFWLNERAGSQTLCNATSASGLRHESDGVIACADTILHVETMRRKLIKGAAIVSMDPAVGDLPKGDVLIEDHRIIAVAPNIAADDADTIDASRTLLLPGLINGHLHTWQTGLRGFAADWSVAEYMQAMHRGLATREVGNLARHGKSLSEETRGEFQRPLQAD
jgi:hypothetical protein